MIGVVLHSSNTQGELLSVRRQAEFELRINRHGQEENGRALKHSLELMDALEASTGCLAHSASPNNSGLQKTIVFFFDLS